MNATRWLGVLPREKWQRRGRVKAPIGILTSYLFLVLLAGGAFANPDVGNGESLRAKLAADDAPMPTDASELDELANSGKLNELRDRLRSSKHIELALNWERSRLLDGGNVAIGVSYVVDLWRAGGALPAPGGDQMKQSAVAFALYDLAVMSLDAGSCADQSAPGHRSEGLIFLFGPIWRYAQTLSEQDKTKVRQVAVKLETLTAPVRRNDIYLCSGGLAEMQAHLAASPQGSSKADTAVGASTDAVIVSKSANYVPKFAPDGNWKPNRDKSRAHLSELFNALLYPSAAAATPKGIGSAAPSNPHP